MKRHLEMIQYYAHVSDVAELVDNFTQGIETFSSHFEEIQCEVLEVINNEREEEHNSIKDRIVK